MECRMKTSSQRTWRLWAKKTSFDVAFAFVILGIVNAIAWHNTLTWVLIALPSGIFWGTVDFLIAKDVATLPFVVSKPNPLTRLCGGKKPTWNDYFKWLSVAVSGVVFLSAPSAFIAMIIHLVKLPQAIIVEALVALVSAAIFGIGFLLEMKC